MARARTRAVVAARWAVTLVIATLAIASTPSLAVASASGPSASAQTIPITRHVDGTPAGQVGPYDDEAVLSLTGPCDGQGPCHVVGLDFVDYDATPTGDGYQATGKPDTDWGPCPPGDQTATLTMTVERSGGRISVSGTEVVDPHHEDYTEIPGKTCVYRHVTTTFEGSAALSRADAETGVGGNAASTSGSSGASIGVIGTGALAVIVAGVAGVALLRGRRPKETVAPSGPPAAFEVRATPDTRPRITIEMNAGGTTARPD